MPPRPILDTLDVIWSSLQSHGVPMALMVGLAMSVWKHVRATRDVDILVGLDEANPNQLISLLTAKGFREAGSPPVVSLGTMRVVRLVFEPQHAFVDVRVDILLAESTYHKQALDRRVVARLPELERELYVLTCADLILHKLIAGRMIDLADAATLIAVNRDSLDEQYLQRWAAQLQLEKPLRDAYESANSDL